MWGYILQTLFWNYILIILWVSNLPSCRLSDMENVTKPWDNSWLGNCQTVSEDHLQDVPPHQLSLTTKFQEVKNFG